MWGRDRPLSGERVLVATRALRSGEALVLPEAGSEEEEEEGEEGEEEGEEEDDVPVVQCDRRDCRRELTDPPRRSSRARSGRTLRELRPSSPRSDARACGS